jgi:hypothetical protein
MFKKLFLVSLIGGSLAACATTSTVNKSNISEPEVIAAQTAWCNALVNISTTYDNQGLDAATKLANQVIDSAYFYQNGPVLFKPTLTTNPQTFRTTRDGALAYFVGNDTRYPNDDGFALKHWRSCNFQNAGILRIGNTATTMGKVNITNQKGETTTVDKTWEFVKDPQGNLRIVVHHSSLEFAQ